MQHVVGRPPGGHGFGVHLGFYVESVVHVSFTELGLMLRYPDHPRVADLPLRCESMIRQVFIVVLIVIAVDNGEVPMVHLISWAVSVSKLVLVDV